MIGYIEALQMDAELVATSSDKVHAKCYEQYDHLKEEFERYKLRAQSVLKNKTFKVIYIISSLPNFFLLRNCLKVEIFSNILNNFSVVDVT